MSSTNRGAERLDNDGYYTTMQVTRAIVSRLVSDGVIDPAVHRYVLEPSVGKGGFAAALVQLVSPEELVGVDVVHTEGVDVVCDFHHGDFLEYEPDDCFDLSCGNPPYNDAERHIRHSATMLDSEVGVMAFLLPLNFLGSCKRQLQRSHSKDLFRRELRAGNILEGQTGLWDTLRPEYVYILDKRPSFHVTMKPKLDKEGQPVLSKRTGEPLMVKSTQDSNDYGVFVWRAATMHEPQQEAKIRFLPWWNDAGRKADDEETGDE